MNEPPTIDEQIAVMRWLWWTVPPENEKHKETASAIIDTLERYERVSQILSVYPTSLADGLLRAEEAYRILNGEEEKEQEE